MVRDPRKPSVEALSSAGAWMVEDAQESVVQVQSAGGRGGAGAGVILSDSGDVMTNHHVSVSGGGRRGRGGNLRVTLRDGRSFGATVTKRDRGLDLALLRLAGGPGDLSAARFGDSDALRVGELVFAIGHPWGRLGAATSGIVSGLGVTSRPGRGHPVRYVQSDVSLAPGNSGGPLLNARGEVVGINAMIFGSMALSIPSNAANAWAASEARPRPRLGVAVRPVELRGDGAEFGMMVVAVRDGSPAARAGLLVGDVLLGDDAEPFEGAGSLLDTVSRAGDAIRLRVMRGGNITFANVSLGASGPGRAA